MIIVADDLTGACDAAAPFAARGARCTVLLKYVVADDVDVLAYSTESRDFDEAAIRWRMDEVAARVDDDPILFKKIDSTLRGNVGAEILAAMAAFRRSTAVITPAFPDMGRRVRAGFLLVDGMPPIHAGERIGLEVLDAADNGDLDRIVDENLRLPGRVLWAGSAGLASALARRLYGETQPRTPPSIVGPVVFCIGSDHPATVAQVRELGDRFPAPMTEAGASERARAPAPRILPIVRGQTSAEEICRGLRGAGALFITGGDTASMVLSAIGAESISIMHEVVTGVPWGVLSGGNFNLRPVVTKSGGFGAPDTLVRVAAFFDRI